MARSLDGGQPRKVANRYLGAAVSFAGSRVVFDQMEIENQIGLQSDLYSVDAAGRSRDQTDAWRACRSTRCLA